MEKVPLFVFVFRLKRVSFKVFLPMDFKHKTNEELLKELEQLQQAYDALKQTYEADIVRHKEAEMENRVLADIVRKSEDFIGVADPQGKALFVNPAGKAMVGLDEDTQTAVEYFFFDEDLAFFHEVIMPSVREKGSWSGEFRLRHFKTGEPVYIYYELFLTQDPSTGRVHNLSAIIRDISAQKQAEEALVKQKDIMAQAEILAELGSWEWDINRDVWTFSQNWKRIHGVTEIQMSTDNLLPIAHPEDRSAIQEAISRALKNGAPYNVKHRIIRQDTGEIRYISASGFTLSDAHGKPKSIIGAVQDITELTLSEREAKNREILLNKIFDILPIGLWFADKDGKLLRGNAAGVRIWGAEPRVPVEEYGVFKARRFPSGEELQPQDWALAHTIQKKVTIADELLEIDAFDGKKKIIVNYTAPLLDDDGELLGAIIVNNDITEKKQAEQELIKAKEKAEESDRLKSAFLANMSHEIRTPMNGILGFADLLKQPNLSGDQQQSYIRIIESSGERLLNIINNIMDISKIEAGLVKLHREQTNIIEQLNYIYTFFKPEVEAKGIKLMLKTSLSETEAIILTDREMVYAILTNLVKNAIKFSDEGYIEIGCFKKGDNLEFYVKDTGIGIPKDRQQAIFERFIQADTSGKMVKQGAGLGLAISRSYVQMLGGTIRVESEVNSGASFFFTLPCKPEFNGND